MTPRRARIAYLQSLHHHRLAIALMIVGKKMEKTVHDEMLNVVRAGNVLLARFSAHRLGGEHDVAEKRCLAGSAPRLLAAGNDKTLVGWSFPR